jgi:hypothetical protein
MTQGGSFLAVYVFRTSRSFKISSSGKKLSWLVLVLSLGLL